MSTLRRGLLVAAALLVVFATAPSTIAAADAPGASTVGVERDAWYATLGCAIPAVCNVSKLLPTTPAPPDTLRVGSVLGLETDRSYLTLDLGDHVASDLASAVLALPVGAVTDGTVDPSSASLRACLVVEPFRSVSGSRETPPQVDCSVAADATASSADPATLVVDLAPLVRAWAAGRPNDGIALLPGAPAPPLRAWELAFVGRPHPGTTTPAVTARVTFAGSPATAPGDGGAASSPTFPAAVVGPSFALPPLGAPAPPPPPAPVPVRAARESDRPAPARGLADAVLLLFPLLLLWGAERMHRLVTRPIDLHTSGDRGPR